MKSFILLSIFLGMTSAHANLSYYQIDCSNATATTKYGSGHSTNEVAFKYIQVHNEDPGFEVYQPEQLNIKVLETKDLKEESYTSCVPGQPGSGSMSSTTWYYERVRITTVDGSEFSETLYDIDDETADLTAIETDWICKRHINSRTLCPK